MRQIRVASIVGTRPEAIKIAPIALAARGRARIAHRIVATGQHAALFDRALATFGVTVDARLHAGADAQLDAGASPSAMAARIAAVRAAVAGHLAIDRPDLVLVQGDTDTAYAAALAAADLGVAIGHVEAGLRTHLPQRPWPEERNRTAIDAMATLLFAPTRGNVANLDGVTGSVHLTGNSGIDALCHVARQLPPPLRRRAGARRRLLVTCHRRENFGAPLVGIARAVRALADRGDIDVHVPLHPNPAVGPILAGLLSDHAAIQLSDPLDYPAMLAAVRDADLVLSDSGGLQEEAPAFGTPLLVLRGETERPEAISGGHARLVGNDPNAILAQACQLLDDPAAHAVMARPGMPFGRGDAAIQILDAIETAFARTHEFRHNSVAPMPPAHHLPSCPPA